MTAANIPPLPPTHLDPDSHGYAEWLRTLAEFFAYYQGNPYHVAQAFAPDSACCVLQKEVVVAEVTSQWTNELHTAIKAYCGLAVAMDSFSFSRIRLYRDRGTDKEVVLQEHNVMPVEGTFSIIGLPPILITIGDCLDPYTYITLYDSCTDDLEHTYSLTVQDRTYRAMYHKVTDAGCFAMDQRPCPSALIAKWYGGHNGDVYYTGYYVSGGIVMNDGKTFANLAACIGSDINNANFTLSTRIANRGTAVDVYDVSPLGCVGLVGEMTLTSAAATMDFSQVHKDNWIYAPTGSNMTIDSGARVAHSAYASWMGVWHRDMGEIDFRSLVDRTGGFTIRFPMQIGLGAFDASIVLSGIYGQPQLKFRLDAQSGSGPTAKFKMLIICHTTTTAEQVVITRLDVLVDTAYMVELIVDGSSVALSITDRDGAILSGTGTISGSIWAMSNVPADKRQFRLGGPDTVSGGASYVISSGARPFIGWLGDVTMLDGNGAAVPKAEVIDDMSVAFGTGFLGAGLVSIVR